jgi:N6-L-threonylcarbamoyladenine synthase
MTRKAGRMLVLGIESSCDEMAAAVVRGGREVLSSVVRGQVEVHRPYGGVVPELASRDHARSVSSVVRTALADARVSPDELEAVAVTAGPGLVGSLLVGLSFGKALAYRLGVPVVGVHHLAGHLAAAELADPKLVPPYVGLVVSGGHTWARPSTRSPSCSGSPTRGDRRWPWPPSAATPRLSTSRVPWPRIRGSTSRSAV